MFHMIFPSPASGRIHSPAGSTSSGSVWPTSTSATMTPGPSSGLRSYFSVVVCPLHLNRRRVGWHAPDAASPTSAGARRQAQGARGDAWLQQGAGARLERLLDQPPLAAQDV